MKILIAGDWHGDAAWAIKMVLAARYQGVKKIIQLGDFGIWTHMKEGVEYLDTVNEALRYDGSKVYFVPGNHENYDHIEWMERNLPQTAHGNTYVRSNIVMLRRDGTSWEWGKRFVAVGGAVSVDRMWRTHLIDWWPQEQLSEAAVQSIERGALGTEHDYFFTHDAPTNIPMNGLIRDEQSHMHRQKFDRIAKALRPRLWFHGHFHRSLQYDFPTYESHTKVFGLDMNGRPNSAGILDTDDDTFVML
jgi:Icc-related predicted phosphoesterase